MDRREFLKALAVAGAAATIKMSGPMEVLAQTVQNSMTGSNYDLVAVMGGEPVDMFRKAISEIGGMGRFVKAGQKVVVKPNIGWDKTPELAGNTNPDLVAEIIRQCFTAGAKEVVVFDHTCDDWRKCYKNSGIEDAATALGNLLLWIGPLMYNAWPIWQCWTVFFIVCLVSMGVMLGMVKWLERVTK